MKKFVAIDFETSYGHIPCSVGVALFEEGELVDTYYTLIKPIDLKFNKINSNINGIYLEDVIDFGYFDNYWNDINKFIDGNLIVAHNASTDVSILQKTVDYYNLDLSPFEYACTLQMARQRIELKNYKLNTLANYFNISQKNYHNALDDAIVCGKLFIELSKLEISKLPISNFKKNSSNKLFNINELDGDVYFNSVDDYFAKKNIEDNVVAFSITEFHSENRDLYSNCFKKEAKESTQVSNKFEGMTMVVSGKFETFSRDEIKQKIEDYGGKNGSSITGKTSVVVAGADMGPAKLEKATKLGIPIWSEDDFINQLNN